MRIKPPKPRAVSKIRRKQQSVYGPNWQELSRRCIELAGGRCSVCGTVGSKANPLNAHHVIAAARGGITTQFHLKCVCEACHSKMPGHSHLRKR